MCIFWCSDPKINEKPTAPHVIDGGPLEVTNGDVHHEEVFGYQPLENNCELYAVADTGRGKGVSIEPPF